MKLRELINKLEKLSNNGENDDMNVECWSKTEHYQQNGNDIGVPINNVYINWYLSNNIESKYIQIEID